MNNQIYDGAPRKALYLGRFHIMHNGHLSIIKFIESQPDVDELIIGVGSSQYSRNNKSFEAPLIINPFTFEERETMIKSALENELTKPYSVLGIMDQHDHQRWARHIVSTLPKFQYFYTNNKREADVFWPLGIECRQFLLKDKYHAQVMREMIANNDDWEPMVPKGAAKVIKEKNLDQVLRDLYKKNNEELQAIKKNSMRLGILTYEQAMEEMNQIK